MPAWVLKAKSLIRKNSLLIKIVTSYILTGVIMLFALTLLLYKQFSQSSLQEVEKISQKMLFQSCKMTDAFWISNFGYMYQEYISDKSLTNAMFSSSFTGIECGDISKKLENIANTSNFIQSIYLYNPTAGIVFSSFGRLEAEEDFFDMNFINSLANYDIHTNALLINRKINFKNGIDENKENVISLVFMQKNNGKVLSAMIYNLKQEMLQNVVASETATDSNLVFIIDNHGTIISHPDASVVNNSIKEEAYFGKITRLETDSESFTDSINGRQYLITFKKWDRLGWIFVSAHDYEELLHQAHTIKKNAFVLLGLFLCISIMVALLFTSNIYIPIYRLIWKIRHRNGNQVTPELNELDYISNTYDKLINDFERNKMLADSGSKALKKNILFEILHGGFINVSEMNKAASSIHLEFNAKCFCVVVLKIDGFYEFSKKNTKENINRFKYILGNIAQNLLCSRYKAEISDSDEDGIDIILFLDQPDALDQLKEAISNIQASAEKNLLISLSAGIGDMVDDVSEIQCSYTNAIEACKYRMIYGKKAVIGYWELRREENFNYPLDIEKNLADALKAGYMNKVSSLFDEFIGKISRFSHDEILLSLAQLALITIGDHKSLHNEKENNYKALDYKAINGIFSRYDNLVQIREWFINAYGSIIKEIKSQKENKYKELVNKIREYINGNYMDSTISIEQIAEKVELSPNYVRILFKENMGKSISNYIAEIRFEKAKELLLQTKYSANKVAEMTGYGSSIYFHSVFKKTEGKSPDEFRKEFRD